MVHLPDHPVVMRVERDGYVDNEPPVVAYCHYDDCEVYEGDKVYVFGDDVVCTDCIFDYVCDHERYI